MSGLPRSYAASGRVLGTRRDPKPGLADQEVYPSRVVRWARASATGLCQLGEVEGGLVSVGEADDHAGGAADGLEVGVECGQEQVWGCSMRLIAAWVTAMRRASSTWVSSAAWRSAASPMA